MISATSEKPASPPHSPPPSRLAAALQQLRQEVQANPRLQAGLAAIALVAIVMGLLNLADRKTAAVRKLETLLAETSGMRKQLGSPMQQSARQGRLNAVREHIDKAFWHSSTPVIAQAELGEWLNSSLREAGVSGATVSQPVFRFLDQGGEQAGGGDTSASQSCRGDRCDLIELRTAIRFPFDPATLGKALAALEGADKQTLIEQLTVNAADRRVELSVLTLAKLSGAATTSATDTPAAAKIETAAPVASEANPEAPKKVVEVKW
ncbi:hypothetical protein FNU76_13265 [Chitinimonas arctica]|uniref:Uncharacterized protein n=1 Tax=Chitinimonas arctica TaxID=2594795 RepID=A0A516SGG6_9NEIS|nr:hypothetical protein [Chitinimonas arctica]QDQ27253.1 hypothetical protein FNU76_13265 [Chitinimonas arctica]